ncbi:MAG: prenyltransferase/squalene oxidase repeat-containing protein [Planctomycetota bacterium]
MLPSLSLALVLLAPQAPGDRGPRPSDAAATATSPAAQEPALDPDLLRACAAAADRGLDWLRACQGKGGAWTGIVGHKMQDDYYELDIGMPVPMQRDRGQGHLGVTALCGMAFLAAGDLPDRGAHGQTVQRTIDYVTRCCEDTGLLTDAGTRMYSHAFATLFLAECYGMAGGKPVKEALERAVNLIVDSQNQYGGWRYNPFDRAIDLSVTVCQLQALRAARNIGIKVPEETIRRAVDYVLASHVGGAGASARGRSRGRGGSLGGGQFYYKIYGSGAYEKPNEYAINAAALTALASAGVYDPDLHQPTLDFLDRHYTELANGRHRQHYYFWYGNYYACQAFFQAGGPRFRTWYERLARDLIAMQRPDGSWVNDCGPGDEFSTAVACLLLQLPRQYLPIFQR